MQYIDYLDYILVRLNEDYERGHILSNLKNRYNKTTENKINETTHIHFIELYEGKYFDRNGISYYHRITPKAKEIMDSYGSISACLDCERKEREKNEKKKSELNELQTENLLLQNRLILLQTKHTKRYILYSVFSFMAGVIAANWKDIYNFLKTVF